MKYYPVFLNIQAKKAVIIGGGDVAERKVLALLKADAVVTVISPELTPRLKSLAKDKSIQHISRSYRNNDLKGAFIVVAATDSEVVNRRVSADACCLVNVVDVPPLCNFIAPSTISRGPLTIAISTSGVSPALAKTIRKELEKQYGPEMTAYLAFLRKLRQRALSEIPEAAKRGRFLKGLSSEKMLQMLRTKGVGEVKKAAVAKLDKILNKS